ncbi:hypothetical protein PIB30_020812 [Stylosanthes scabra]|uniref:Uncharacterized protein n=1 Tax=Stylosanthes scabra TaxID=79078 RepID=A0ABU6T8G6_9FABA|nr:hypothetical protein [Stylosanthes scabra]
MNGCGIAVGIDGKACGVQDRLRRPPDDAVFFLYAFGTGKEVEGPGDAIENFSSSEEEFSNVEQEASKTWKLGSRWGIETAEEVKLNKYLREDGIKANV